MTPNEKHLAKAREIRDEWCKSIGLSSSTILLGTLAAALSEAEGTPPSDEEIVKAALDYVENRDGFPSQYAAFVAGARAFGRAGQVQMPSEEECDNFIATFVDISTGIQRLPTLVEFENWLRSRITPAKPQPDVSEEKSIFEIIKEIPSDEKEASWADMAVELEKERARSAQLVSALEELVADGTITHHWRCAIHEDATASCSCGESAMWDRARAALKAWEGKL